MKRFLPIFLVVVLMLGAFSSISAQDGPEGEWLGTWPYVLMPDHHLNGFAAGGPNSNLGNVYRGLTELTPAFYMWASDEWMPVLAESWGFNEDATAYAITLRSDATWSNGEAINADDIIVTYALGRVIGWSQFNHIDRVEKIDDFTVHFHFIDEPSLLAERLLLKEYIVYRGTYQALADEALALFETGADAESEEWAALRTSVTEFRPDEYVTSGPYTYSLDDVGDSFMTLSWQPNSIYSDSVQFGSIKLWSGETDTTTPLILSGELAHSTNVYPPSSIEAFQAEGVDIITIPRGYGPGMLFNHTVAPWDMKEVRQAVAMIIDRDQNAFLTNGLGAQGTVYMSGLLDANVPVLLTEEAIAELDLYEFDTDRASALLESVGFSRNGDGIWADADGNTLSAEWKFPAEFADFSAASQDAIAQMNDFGFDITARALPWQETAADIRAGNFELSIWSWGLGSPFASRQFWNPVQRFNYTDLADGQRGMDFNMEFEFNGEMVNLDEMIDNASSGLDVEVQQERASEIALILNDLMPYIPLNVILSAEPFNTSVIAGAPAMDDPILANPSGSGDHFIIYYVLTGVLSPAE